MSKSGGGLGKSLKGITIASSSTAGIEDAVINQISSGSIEMTNIQIVGGVINSTVIGNDIQGPIYATILQTGSPDGTGYDVTFYGDTLGEYFQWNASLGLANIQGDLSVSQTTDLGNIRIAGNTISTTNTNGDIIIDPNGSGGITLTGSLVQNTTSGNISFTTLAGGLSASVSDDINLTSSTGGVNLTTTQEQVLTSTNGDIILSAGSNKVGYIITNITSGLSPTITSSTPHFLETGDTVNIVSPTLNGKFVVASVIDSSHFTVSTITSTVSTTSGSFIKDADIFLTGTAINIPYDTKLTYGIDSNFIQVSSLPLDDMTIASNGNINISPSGSAILSLDKSLVFGNSTNTITGSSGGLVVNGNVVLNDPIPSLGSNLVDGKDRGVQYKVGSSGSGYFGYDASDGYFMYVPNATNTGDVISGALGNAKFNVGSFNSLSVASIATGTIDACNLNCNGTMTLTGTTGIRMQTPTVTIPQGTFLKFGDTGTPSTLIYKEASGIDLVMQSQGHIFMIPGSSLYDVILPNGSALVLNGEGGAQKIESTSLTELSISSSSFLNLNQISGGVRLTQSLPLLFNTDETSKITGDSMGNLITQAGNSINLIPASGQVTLPIAKRIEFGNPLDYIGSSSLNNVVLSTGGVLAISSALNSSITTVSGDILLTPGGASKNIVIPVAKKIVLGNAGENIGSDSSNNVILNSTGSIIENATASINLNPGTFVNIPYSKPLNFGSSSENITGSSGNLGITAAQTSVSGNFTVNGANTVLNSTQVSMVDPIPTLGVNLIDGKDRGISYKVGVSSLGYFGYDATDGYFMYVPDATNTAEVISGALGNAKFGVGSFTSLNVNNGAVSNVSTISSSGNLNIAPSGNVLLNPVGGNVVIPVNTDLLFDGEDAKFYSDGVDLHAVVASPGRFVVDSNTVINGDLSVIGNVSFSGGSTTNFTVDRFTVPGNGTGSPNGTSNISFITVSGSGAGTGTMPTATQDGFIKNICISSLASGCTYRLSFPTGRLLDPVSGTGVAKTLVFDKAGQSVQMVWDAVASVFIITQGGADVQAA